MHDPFAPSKDRPTLSLEDADALLGERRVIANRRPPLVVESGELTSEEIFQGREAESHFGGAIPVTRIRYTHHRLAQCLAAGISATASAALCNYSVIRVYSLMESPAFLELLAFYRGKETPAMVEFADAAKNLSLDMLHLLQEKLDEHPEQFTPSMLGELIKTLADRSGNAPVTKTQNVNVNLNMGDKLRAARERAAEVERGKLIDGTAKVLSG